MADVAEKTLLSTMRPKIIVRRIAIHRGTEISTYGVPDPDPWRIDFDIVNAGQGKARVIGHNFVADRTEKDFRDFGLTEAKTAPFTLEPGQKRSMSIEVKRDLMEILRHIGPSGLALGYQNTDHLYFWGNAQFVDAVGIARDISVCRLYDNKSGRFKPTDDPDYEYPDQEKP